MELLLAKTLLPVCAPPVHDAAVLVDRGHVVALGPRNQVPVPRGTPTTDLGDAIILPGLVNAHCHLDYTVFHKTILGAHSFPDWILRINALKRSLGLDDYIASIRNGIAQSLAYGTTTMANIESFPEILNDLPDTPLRIIWCLEMMDVRSRVATPDFATGCLRVFDEGEGGASRLHRFGLSPHAPYTTSPELYRLAAECAMRHNLLFTTHVSESFEEMEMFAEGTGSLHALVTSLKNALIDYAAESPLTHLLRHDALPDRALLVHMNGLSTGDLEMLRESGARRGFSVVHCPQSHAYFSHPRFPYQEISDAGVTVCLGTDSLASSPSLSMFDEMRAFRAVHPDTPPWKILRMATLNGARALGLAGQAGCLAPGCRADLAVLPAEPGAVPCDPYEAVVSFSGRPARVYAGGQLVAGTDT